MERCRVNSCVSRFSQFIDKKFDVVICSLDLTLILKYWIAMSLSLCHAKWTNIKHLHPHRLKYTGNVFKLMSSLHSH